MCPNNTYDVDLKFNSTHTRKHCLPCTAETCPKSCQLPNSDYSVNKFNIHLFDGCEELKGNLKIIHTIDNRYLLY
jgi:hypothetical protein